jgi:hypothetical protein
MTVRTYNVYCELCLGYMDIRQIVSHMKEFHGGKYEENEPSIYSEPIDKEAEDKVHIP